MRRLVAELPLHTGHAPPWLFKRMVRLGRVLSEALVTEFGTQGFLDRVSDPFWFQALGCLLGFDWHSSGLTTTTCGALKEGLQGLERGLGLYIAGGKGRVSRRTPEEIRTHAEAGGFDAAALVYASRLSAKVDSAAVQDGFQIYHHCFFFDARGEWAVVQQGMNESTGWARRYHWRSEPGFDFVCEPHRAVCSKARTETLNLVAAESERARQAIAAVSRLPAATLLLEIQKSWDQEPAFRLPRRHGLLPGDLRLERLGGILRRLEERQPEDFERVLGVEGVGARTLRSLSLVAELLYGAKPSFRDPARFSFAHGGKDGIPFPVDRRTYDRTIAVLERALRFAHLGRRDELQALRRLEQVVAAPARGSTEGEARQTADDSPSRPQTP